MSYGANIGAATSRGHMVLHKKCQNGNVETIRTLLQSGAEKFSQRIECYRAWYMSQLGIGTKGRAALVTGTWRRLRSGPSYREVRLCVCWAVRVPWLG